jgi:hypothetical protein
MKIRVFILSFFLSLNAFSQSTCKELYNVLDSIYTYNTELVQHKGDTTFIKNILLNKYQSLTLYNSERPRQPVSGFLFFSVDIKLLPIIHQCIIDKATEKGWFAVVSPAQADGFSRLNVYDSKKKKQRILLYANDTFETTKLKIGISIYWQ